MLMDEHKTYIRLMLTLSRLQIALKSCFISLSNYMAVNLWPDYEAAKITVLEVFWVGFYEVGLHLQG